MSNTIYIENLPAYVTEHDLELHFSICGHIESCRICSFLDHREERRSYGFITFRDPYSMEKATVFNESNYQRHIIKVLPADRMQYGTYLGGIPNSVSTEEISQWLWQQFPNRFYTKIDRKEGPQVSCVFVNFRDEESRQEYVQQKFPFSRQRAQIKQHAKKTAGPAPAEGKFQVRVFNLPSNLGNEDFRKLLLLFDAAVETSINQSDKSGTFTFTTRQAVESIMKFDNLPVNGWALPIRLQISGDLAFDLGQLDGKLANLEFAEQNNNYGENRSYAKREHAFPAEQRNDFKMRGHYREEPFELRNVDSSSTDSMASTPFQKSGRSSALSTDEDGRTFGRERGSLGRRDGMARERTSCMGAEDGTRRHVSDVDQQVWRITLECDNKMPVGQVTRVFERLGEVRSCTASGPGGNSFNITVIPN